MLVDPDPAHGDGLRLRVLHAPTQSRDMDFRRDAPGLYRRRRPLRLAGDGRQPADRRHGHLAGARFDGGQGDPHRLGRIGHVGHDDHRHVERFGQLDARFADPVERHAPDAQHADQLLVRRRGSRVDELFRIPHHRRLHQRTDGGPHAGVPRPESRGARDEDRHAGRAAASLPDPRRHGHLGRRGRREPRNRVAEQPLVPRIERNALRIHLLGGQQRLGIRGTGRQHAVLEHLDGHRPDHGPLLPDRGTGRHSRTAGVEEVHSRERRHAPHRHGNLLADDLRRHHHRCGPLVLPGAGAGRRGRGFSILSCCAGAFALRSRNSTRGR